MIQVRCSEDLARWIPQDPRGVLSHLFFSPAGHPPPAPLGKTGLEAWPPSSGAEGGPCSPGPAEPPESLASSGTLSSPSEEADKIRPAM